jgi:hypothetical protein
MKKALWFIAILAAAFGVYWYFFRKNNAETTAERTGNGSGLPKFEIAAPGVDVVNRTFEDFQNGRLNASVSNAASIVQSPQVANNIITSHVSFNALG